MLENYFPVLLFAIVGLGFGCVPLILGRLLAPYRPDSEKVSAYECGFEPFEDARIQFDVRYYLVAIIFILFDLETVFLFIWALAAQPVTGFMLATFGIFLFLLVLILLYVYRQRLLEAVTS